MSREVEELFKEQLVMYPHLKNIRNKLWASDSKSRVSVMIGAGFSTNAKKIEDSFEGMAVWNDLRNRLIQDLAHHSNIESKDVLEIGQIYVKEYGRASLDEILKEAIPDDNYEPDDLHYNLLNLPWADIYTTNYDTLLERAKRLVYERNYEVIYDISDIPSSVQPRIIKLHGSFPANRPFIFTADDYNNYPEKFSPFVNMVQQSIMETTLVLVGFSGDDPNFNRWTTWVLENLGDHMPKIYMIGYGQEHRKLQLECKGITLIDFKEIYQNHEKPFYSMFTDIFEFLSYRKREEKTKWPHRIYHEKMDIDNLIYNRETYPGWIIAPDEVRRKYAKYIRNFARNYILNNLTGDYNEEIALYLNEILWCYEKFIIPLDKDIRESLIKFIDDQDKTKKIDQTFLFLILRLLKEARLNFSLEEFDKYTNILSKATLNKEQQHSFSYEKILYHLNFNNIDVVDKLMQAWDVDSKEIIWGIKKATIFSRIKERNRAKEMFEEYLQTIRRLLAIKPDDFRLLSLESIVLCSLHTALDERDYGYDRLRYLSSMYCDINKEFNRTVVSIKKYENKLGTTKKRGFDPRIQSSSTKYGDYMTSEIFDSFAVSQIQETYALALNDNMQYDLALENLDIIYPLYSQIRRMSCVKVKEIDRIFPREFVYQLDSYNLNILVKILENTLSREYKSNMNSDLSLEILSRIYFALSVAEQKKVDLKVIQFIDEQKVITISDKGTLNKVIERIFFAKNREDSKVFCQQLINLKIKNQKHKNGSVDTTSFFDPFLIFLRGLNKLSDISLSEEQLNSLFHDLNNKLDDGFRESALIRLTFLTLTNSLSEKYYKKFVNNIQILPAKNQNGISNFIFGSVFDKIIHSDEPNKRDYRSFLKRDIPTFYHQGVFSYGTALDDYFNELKGIVPDFIDSKEKQIPKCEIYNTWLDKFYKWWESQKKGLLRSLDQSDAFLGDYDYLLPVIILLKNNIWGTIPEHYLNQEDKNKIKQIFFEINEQRFDVSFYLIPCLVRLNIPIHHSIKDVLNGLLDRNIEKVKVCANTIGEYLIFIDKGEITDTPSLVKTELLNAMKYSNQEVLKTIVDAVSYTFEFAANIFDIDDCDVIINYLQNYLEGIKKGYIEVSTREDFELLDSFSKMIAYMCKNRFEIVDNRLDEWKEYICSHRLPEVRRHTDIFHNQKSRKKVTN
ncbi:SIR2 family protein [Priestia megaterium]|uniref:SIR2 family NAD-dependent protein deacylase n=1 Tax=Priestia megaterium TaxID=1404 RepID=UPI002E228727|nr:SIR2 family protein [Priestia megaterium]